MKRILFPVPEILSLMLALLLFNVAGAKANTELVVAADGNGQFTNVQAAINAAPQNTNLTNWCVILIKPGIYQELIYVQREKHFVRLLGEDPEQTVLTYDLHAGLPGPDGRPIGTFRTPSTVIDADDFVAENLTFQNSAGPRGQALAVRLDGDRIIFRNCRFLGWQDTILCNRGRHYYENCYIAGAVDFIFGGATEFYEHCHIHCLGNGYITAASTPADHPFGYVFSHCRITGENPGVQTYLGRPWRAYASVTFLNTEMSGVVRPAGWDNWRDPAREQTARYAEFKSTGPGANPQARVKWAHPLTDRQAAAITVGKVLGGSDAWNPQSILARLPAVDFTSDVIGAVPAAKP
ncbi:MAG TPA: pectinesterase family protein [Candidatus Sulfopaludibacter sp.]|nr:pectinesterase family protein [Candidatus Sulfopaludibacter sp.]